MSTYRVQLLSGRSADFAELDAASASAQNQADHGFQAAVLQVESDGNEVLVKTYLRRIAITAEAAAVDAPHQSRGPSSPFGHPFVFVKVGR